MSKLLFKLKTKIKNLLQPSGVSVPEISKETWDKQYSSGDWDHLESDQEKAHYDIIVKFVQKYAGGKSVFDIGCGNGVLYKYLKASGAMDNSKYLGIDISESAVDIAGEAHGRSLFKTVNYQNEGVSNRFGCVIYNETLYYFKNPQSILDKSIEENLLAEGVLIVSMVKYGKHHKLWEMIDDNYLVLDEDTVDNDNNTSWTVKVIKPKVNG